MDELVKATEQALFTLLRKLSGMAPCEEMWHVARACLSLADTLASLKNGN